MNLHQQWLDHLTQPTARLRWERELTGHHRREKTYHINRRTVPWHIIILVISGELPGTIGGRSVTLRRGQLVWLPPQVVNGFTWSPRLVYQACWFGLDSEPALGLSPLVVDRASSCRPLIETISRELQHEDELSSNVLKALLTQLACAVLRCRDLIPQGVTLTLAQRRHLENYVNRHIHERIEPGELANLFELGTDWFSRIFTRTYGLAPRSWIVEERMRHAAEMLRDPALSVSQVSNHLGINSSSLFHRQFKRIHGVGPQQWREERMHDTKSSPN